MEEIIEAYLKSKDISNIRPNNKYEKTLLALISRQARLIAQIQGAKATDTFPLTPVE